MGSDRGHNDGVGPEGGEHVWCMPGCLREADTGGRLKRRAAEKRVDLQDLRELVAVTNAECMICRSCHASVIDRGRVGSTIRGIVCRWCRTRLSVVDGATGNLARRTASTCRCDPGSPDWAARMNLATRSYLERSERSTVQDSTPRVAFAHLVAEARTDGVDPTDAWTKPSTELPGDAAIPPGRATTAGRSQRELTVAPLLRDRCEFDCVQHEEHVYVACFDEPTLIPDRDHHPEDPEHNYPLKHYVGWTTQQPPVKRLNQHGVVCRRQCVLLVPGSKEDESDLKATGRCPKCNATLWYYHARKPVSEPHGRQVLIQAIRASIAEMDDAAAPAAKQHAAQLLRKLGDSAEL